MNRKQKRLIKEHLLSSGVAKSFATLQPHNEELKKNRNMIFVEYSAENIFEIDRFINRGLRLSPNTLNKIMGKADGFLNCLKFHLKKGESRRGLTRFSLKNLVEELGICMYIGDISKKSYPMTLQGIDDAVYDSRMRYVDISEKSGVSRVYLHAVKKKSASEDIRMCVLEQLSSGIGKGFYVR